ncbi:MAG TPA: PLP-dependent aspartate aminotransferase family protein [Ktedonobacteraceae bacterium]|nr:PLP-dependent aspartate aminotransferase family protein [Ktedonobacteraceae bacterium]
MKEHNFPSLALDTLLVHSTRGYHTTHNSGKPTVEPISTSTTYLHRNAELLDRAFSGSTQSGEPAYVYARQGNPNAQTLEKVLTLAEKGAGAVVFSSGMAAIHAALLAAGLAPGSKILAAQDLYGPTIGMLRTVFVPAGIEVVLHDLCIPNVIEIVRAEQPDVIYVETLSNPLAKVIDLDAISAIAKEIGAVSIVDSTFTTPYLINPIDHGFDMVIHSATKYLGGHGDATAGVVISARNNLVEQLRGYAIMLGAMLSPFDSYLVTRGLKTLALRMERHCNNASEISQFLQKHKAVERVHYPGLPNHPQHELASRLLMNHHYGGLLAFELKEQTREAAYRFMDKLQLCLPATTLGDVYSEVSHPAMSSHRNLTTSELKKFGISDGCIRLSAGIEDVKDILHDLDQALLSS